MTVQKIDIRKFLELSETIPVADVRSPSEFASGHIPRAFSIPLFDDGGRASVGTKFKHEGRLSAIVEGLRLTGPEIAGKLEEALKTAKDGRLLIHCWRGGMRSEAMAWLFSLGGIAVDILEGGYKSYRIHILERLSEKRKMIVLGGMTGSSKTQILRYLKSAGQQFIDLEQLANHRGSAFGALGQEQQPTTEHFGNLLFDEISKLDEPRPVWVEDESRNIGTVFMPDVFYQNMQASAVIVLVMDMKLRLPRLIEEYAAYPGELLIRSIQKISKRLGGDRTHDAINAVEASDFSKAIEIVLFYYDKTYNYSLKRKNPSNLTFLVTDTDDIEINASKVLEAAKKINW